tara:strand:- start:24634 stop:25164 length:531 start_codon:yes stop_codon:yes gene_type:complete
MKNNEFSNQANTLIKRYYSFIKKYLKSKNKKEIFYSEGNKLFADFHYFYIEAKANLYLLSFYNLSNIEENYLHTQNKFFNFYKKEEKKYYNDWIKNEKKEYIYKIVDGFKEPLKCYKRPLSFTLNSVNDPLTDDEISYLKYSFNKIYKSDNINLNKIRTIELTVTLNSLLWNHKDA